MMMMMMMMMMMIIIILDQNKPRFLKRFKYVPGVV